MEYSNENYESDLKVASIVFDKYFKNQIDHKEDLIQCAVITLWHDRDKFDESKCKLSTFRFNTAYFAMLKYLRSYNHSWRKGNDETFILSLSQEVEGTDGEILESCIASEEIDFDERLNLNYLRQSFEHCCKQIHVSKNNKFTKELLNLIGKGFCDMYISKKIGCTRELVRIVRKKIIPIYHERLKAGQYLA